MPAKNVTEEARKKTENGSNVTEEAHGQSFSFLARYADICHGYRSISLEVSALLPGHQRGAFGAHVLGRDCRLVDDEARFEGGGSLLHLRVFQTGGRRSSRPARLPRGGRIWSASTSPEGESIFIRRSAGRGNAEENEGRQKTRGAENASRVETGNNKTIRFKARKRMGLAGCRGSASCRGVSGV